MRRPTNPHPCRTPEVCSFLPLLSFSLALSVVPVRKGQHYATNCPKRNLFFFPSLCRCVQNSQPMNTPASLLLPRSLFGVLCVILLLFHIPVHLVIHISGLKDIWSCLALSRSIWLFLCLMCGDRTWVQPSPFASTCTWHIEPSKLQLGLWLSPHHLVE